MKKSSVKAKTHNLKRAAKKKNRSLKVAKAKAVRVTEENKKAEINNIEKHDSENHDSEENSVVK